MKSIVIVLLALGILVASICCSPLPSRSSDEVKCVRNECIFPKKDYGPSVTPYTPTMQPRIRTLLVPPLWVNTTWMEIANKPSTAAPPDEDTSQPNSAENDYDTNEEDNMV